MPVLANITEKAGRPREAWAPVNLSTISGLAQAEQTPGEYAQGLTVSTSGDPQKIQGAVTRAQWEDFQNRYIPIENEVIDKVTADIEPEADRAGDFVRRAADNARDQRTRQLSRLGVNLTERQRVGLARRREIQNTLDTATAENTTRRSLRDRNLNALAGLIGTGKGIAGGANQGLSAAADMAAQREAQGRANKARHKQQNMQLAGLAAGAMLMMM